MKRIAGCLFPVVAVLGVVFAAAGPGVAQTSKAFEVCAKTALQQAMLVRSVIAQSDIRDRSGAVTGAKVDLDVNALGKKTKVSCYYTAATRTAVIRQYQAGAAPGSGGSSGTNTAQAQRDAVRACQRAGQQQGLMLDNIAAQSDVYNRRGQISGREVVINVFQAGKPAQLVCEYDYETRQTSLELRRPQLR
jgi:hypothetical protein